MENGVAAKHIGIMHPQMYRIELFIPLWGGTAYPPSPLGNVFASNARSKAVGSHVPRVLRSDCASPGSIQNLLEPDLPAM
jgi:hypothetical protein